MAWHKEQKRQRNWMDDGGVGEAAAGRASERHAQLAAQTGNRYDELMAESMRYCSEKDWRRAARVCREAIPLKPDEPWAYFYLCCALSASSHYLESGKMCLEAKERFPVGTYNW